MFAGKQERPLGYAQVVIEDGNVYVLPGLDRDGLINGYSPKFTRIRVCEFGVTESLELGGISYRDDGEHTKAGEGMPVFAGEREDYLGDPANLMLMRLNDVPVVVHVLYYAAALDDEV